MIRATIIRHPDGEYRGFQILGHADYAETGRDIICAAVSTLAINTANAVEAFTTDPARASVEDGLLQFQFTGACSEKSKLLMDALVLGLTDIQQQYGDKYLKLGFKEV